MRVLMLGWELPPHNSGGLGVACYHLCRALARRRIDIEFMVPYRAEHGLDFMTVTAAIPKRIKHVFIGGSAYDSYRYVTHDNVELQHSLHEQRAMYEEAVSELVQEQEYDVIHAHDWLSLGAGLCARRLSGLPVIAHMHSIESDRAGGGGGNPLVREIEATALQQADAVVAVSEFTRQSIHREYGVPLENIQVIHNSFELAEIVPLEQPHRTSYPYLQLLQSQGWRIVTYVGRLTIQKGLTNLLRAAQLVVARAPKTIFVITGGGEQYDELVKLSADLGIGKNVLFTGFLRGKAWRDTMAVGDLFVMPSVSEPFGLVALEAVAYGTPTLITHQSGVAEVLHNTLKVDFWDVDEMANQIIAAVRHEPLRHELLQNASKELASMSWRHTAEQVTQLYDRLVTQSSLVAGVVA